MIDENEDCLMDATYRHRGASQNLRLNDACVVRTNTQKLSNLVAVDNQGQVNILTLPEGKD